MKAGTWIVATVAATPLVLALVLHTQIERSYHQSTTTTLLFSLLPLYVFLGQYYYWKSESFYLWVQRQRLNFRRTHTYWHFSVSYHNVRPLFYEGASQAPAIQKELETAFKAGMTAPLKFETLKNSVVILIDDRDRFEISLDFDDQSVSLQTSKMLVPSHLYWHKLDELQSIFQQIEKTVKPGETDYRLEVSFDNNPYFGFFIRHIPPGNLETFNCSFQSQVCPDARVRATKDTIYIDGKSAGTLDRIARIYLGLSAELLTTGVTK